MGVGGVTQVVPDRVWVEGHARVNETAVTIGEAKVAPGTWL